MEVFVVVTRYMMSLQAEQVFSTREIAESYIERIGPGGDPTVAECHVHGELEKTGVVFAACSYVRSKDVHFFEDLYGNREKAKIVAGDKGRVYLMKIDDKAN